VFSESKGQLRRGATLSQHNLGVIKLTRVTSQLEETSFSQRLTGFKKNARLAHSEVLGEGEHTSLAEVLFGKPSRAQLSAKDQFLQNMEEIDLAEDHYARKMRLSNQQKQKVAFKRDQLRCETIYSKKSGSDAHSANNKQTEPQQAGLL